MDDIATALSAFFGAFPAWVNAALAVIAGASAITALTPSAKDDRFLARVQRVLELLALNIGHARRK